MNRTFSDTLAGNAVATPRPMKRPLSSREDAFPARVLSGLLAWADERSVPPDQLVPGLGERNPRLALSYEATRLGFARARHMHGSAELACLTGDRKTVHHLGPLGPAQMAQETLGGAMEYGLRYQMVAGSMSQIGLVVDGDTAAIECHPLFEDAECAPLIDIDHLVTAFNMMSAFCQAPLPIVRLELTATDRQVIEPLKRLLRAPVVLGHSFSRLVFQTALLSTPNLRFDAMTLQFWSQACEQEAGTVGLGAPLTLRQRLFRENGRLCSLNQLAQDMRVSVRTVHRMLSREGIDYSTLLDRQQRKCAEHMLLRGDNMDTIAEKLDFSDARSFRRAFRRWTGASPHEFRHKGALPGLREH